MKSLDDLFEKHKLLALTFEKHIFNTASHFSNGYKGGYWKPKSLNTDENGFYLMLDDTTQYEIQNTMNYYDKGSMDSETFSLSIFAYTCNTAGSQLYTMNKEEMAKDLFDLYNYCTRNAQEILGEQRASQFYAFLD